MFLRFAAKGSAVLVGLAAAVLPSSGATVKTVKPTSVRPVRVSTSARKPAAAPIKRPSATLVKLPVIQPLTALKRDPNHFGVRQIPFFQLHLPLSRSATAVSAYAAPQAALKAPQKIHGGTKGIDTNITIGTYNSVEPRFLPNGGIIYSANGPGGTDKYPPAAPDPATNPDADPPLGIQMPAFLVGVNDYHLWYKSSSTSDPRQLTYSNTSEEFEPTGSTEGYVAYSAFLGIGNAIYKPDVTLSDGSNLDYHGFPVRTIVAGGATEQKVLQPDIWGVLPIPTVGSDGNTTNKNMPFFTPDCSPVYYPGNGRFVFFVSLRNDWAKPTADGWNKDKPDTHYTRLFMWDTSKALTDAGYVTLVYASPGKSILFPRFSPDGKYLTWTEADVKFEADPKTAYIQDPVFDFDVTKAELQTSFKSRIYIGSPTLTVPTDDSGVATVRLGNPVQLTAYKDENKQEPRDLMPFFSGLGQVGFSSDRLDKDGDGLADGVETDPTKALFDVYVYPFPYDPVCSDETAPDSMAHRQTLGDQMVRTIPGDDTSPLIHLDDSNELHADGSPVDYTSNLLSMFTPNLIYQADDRNPTSVDPNDLGWDLWTTDRSGSITLQGDILFGLPAVTPDDSLPAAQKADLILTHRKGLPGDYVNISVKLNPKYYKFDPDTKAATTEVYALVKDPDNRIFRTWRSEVQNGVVEDVYEEIDNYPVKFCHDDFVNYTTMFGGVADAPQIGHLIKLATVDAAPNSTTPIAYTGKWYTPLEVSDFLIDVIVKQPATDKTTAVSYITDNIGGFSTAPFIPSSRVLFVSDFMAGQKAIDATTGGTANIYGTDGLRLESFYFDRPGPTTVYGSPSYPIYSQTPGNTDWAAFGPRQEWQSAPTVSEDPISGRLVSAGDGVLNPNDPLAIQSLGGNEYDLWRVQCREPITLDDQTDGTGKVIARGVMHNYLPYTHTQPGYPLVATLRTQRVADRCVVWIAPHAGDLNGNAGANSTEVGTIANLSTQTELVNYMNRGGRLLLAGTDVAFNVSANNPASTNALLARMKVAFQSDADLDEQVGFVFDRTDLTHVRETGLGGLNALPYAMAEPHWYDGDPTDVPLASPARYREHESRLDASLSNYHQDAITGVGIGTVGGAEPVWTWATSDRGAKTLLTSVTTHNPIAATENTSTSRTAFFSFNVDSIRLGANGPINSSYYLSPNYPATILHNTVDFFCTSGFKGQVFISNDVASPKNVLVYLEDYLNTENFGKVCGTALTDDNGNYKMDGIEPSRYYVRAYKTGFSMQHEYTDYVDTAGIGENSYTVDNITLFPTQPGAVSGTVFEKGSSPRIVLPGVPVTLTDITAVVHMSAVTGADGKFSFTNVPTGSYIITTPFGQYRTNVYYAAFSSPVGTITNGGVVVSTNSTTVYDVALTASSPITISGKVTDATTNYGIQGVPVTATDSTAANTATVSTDVTGAYAFGDLPDGLYTITTPEGQYTMVVSATDATKNEQHYYDSSTNAGSPLPATRYGNVAFNIALKRTAPKPATIVVSVKDGFTQPAVAAAGAIISVFDVSTGALATTLDGAANPFTTTVTGAEDDGTGTFHVSAGAYKITVIYKALKPQFKTITAAPDDPADPTFANKVNFEFGVVHTFTAGSVLMASLPYDYSGTNASPITFSTVLTLTDAQLANAIVGYNASTQAFLFYPNYPADTARLGRGYGFKLPVAGKVVEAGSEAQSSTAIIRTEIGWNLIGDPFNGTVVWNGTDSSSVKVALRDDSTQTLMTIDDAKSKGYILSDLWGGSSVDANGNSVYSGTYQVASPTSSLQAWQAYWVKVAQPLLFYVPKPVTATAATAKAIATIEAMKGALMPTGSAWGLNITASADGMTDNGLALGISARGTTGIDAGLDLAKPLPISGGDYLYTAFPMGKAGIYATDVRRVGTTNTWTFTVNTSLNARPVAITWTPAGILPAGYSVWLVDTATGKRTNMSAVNQYAFRSARNGGIRTFRVELRSGGVTR